MKSDPNRAGALAQFLCDLYRRKPRHKPHNDELPELLRHLTDGTPDEVDLTFRQAGRIRLGRLLIQLLDGCGHAAKSGFTPDYDTAGGSMVAVQEHMARLTGEDREAIAAYLKAVPAVE